MLVDPTEVRVYIDGYYAGVVDDFDEAVKEDGRPLTGGYIALQSESHPVQFRQVLLRRLPSG